jgi:hypothetical protein
MTEHNGAPLQSLAIVDAMMTMMLKRMIEGPKADQNHELALVTAVAPAVSSLKDVHHLMNAGSTKADHSRTGNRMDRSVVNQALMLTMMKTQMICHHHRPAKRLPDLYRTTDARRCSTDVNPQLRVVVQPYKKMKN